MLYCGKDKLCVDTTGSALRSAGTDSMDASIFSGKVVQTYIGFLSDHGKEIASSIYTGQLTVS